MFQNRHDFKEFLKNSDKEVTILKFGPSGAVLVSPLLLL